MTVRIALAALVVFAEGAALADGFGGFSADGKAYLEGKTRVCTPLGVDAEGAPVNADPACRELDAEAIKAHGFKKPRPTRKLAARVAGGAIVVSEKGKTKARWGPPDAPARVTAVYAAADGFLVAVDYQVGKATRTIAFSLPRPPPPSRAAERAMKHGGRFEQRLLPCEQAGVKVVLEPSRKAKITIETRCQAEKDRLTVSGTWEAEGDSDVTIVLPQDEGPDERLPCRLDAEDALICSDEDVTFQAHPVIR